MPPSPVQPTIKQRKAPSWKDLFKFRVSRRRQQPPCPALGQHLHQPTAGKRLLARLLCRLQRWQPLETQAVHAGSLLPETAYLTAGTPIHLLLVPSLPRRHACWRGVAWTCC